MFKSQLSRRMEKELYKNFFYSSGNVDNFNYLGVDEFAAGWWHPHPLGQAGGGGPRSVGVVRGVHQPAALQLDTILGKPCLCVEFMRNLIS